METLRTVVVRHAGAEWSAQRRFTGSRDVPLSEKGTARAEAVARALASHAITAVYASPLDRARTTAEIVAKPHQLGVRITPAFRDVNFGAWEGLTADEVARRFPRDWAVWREAPHELVAHGGESLAEVADRVAHGIAELQRAHPAGTLVLVTHAIPIRLIVLSALGLGADRLWSVDASPAGISELEYTGDWVTVHRMNTTAHLAASAPADADAAFPAFPGAPDEVAPHSRRDEVAPDSGRDEVARHGPRDEVARHDPRDEVARHGPRDEVAP